MKLTAKYLRMGEAENYFGLNRKTIYAMIERGELKAIQTPGGHYRIDRESLIDPIREHADARVKEICRLL